MSLYRSFRLCSICLAHNFHLRHYWLGNCEELNCFLPGCPNLTSSFNHSELLVDGIK